MDHAPENENKVDQLGMEKHYIGIANFLRTCDTPMTISIQGDWGTGKTETMHFIQRHLEEQAQNNGFCAIWFNTWQFTVLNENRKLIIQLMKMMIQKLEELADTHLDASEKESFLERNKELIVRLGKIIAFSMLQTFLENTKGISFVAQTFFKVRDGVREMSDSAKKREQEDAFIKQFNEEYDEVKLIEEMKKLIVEQIGSLKSSKKSIDRIYLFIDDLDRLDPIVAVELMEGIKNLLDCEGCVFVLAVDNEVVERGLQAKFGKEKYGAPFDAEKARKFFDKIIQVPFRLPVNAYSIQSFVTARLEKISREDAENAEQYAELLSRFSESNPRTIERSFNLLRLQQMIDGKRNNAQTNLRQYALLLFKLESEHLYVNLFVELIQKYPDAAECSAVLERLWNGEYETFDIDQLIEESDHAMENGIPVTQKKQRIQRTKQRIRAVLHVFFESSDGEFSDQGYSNTTEFISLIQEMAPEVKPETTVDLLLADNLITYYALLARHNITGPNDVLPRNTSEVAAILQEKGFVQIPSDSRSQKPIMVKGNLDTGSFNLTFYTRRSTAEIFGEYAHLFQKKVGREQIPEGKFGYYDQMSDPKKPRITISVRQDMKSPILLEIVERYLDSLN